MVVPPQAPAAMKFAVKPQGEEKEGEASQQPENKVQLRPMILVR